MKRHTTHTTVGLIIFLSACTLESCQSKRIEHRGGKIVDETAIVLPYDWKATEQSLLRAAGMRPGAHPQAGFPYGYLSIPGMGSFPLYPLDPVRQPIRLERINYQHR